MKKGLAYIISHVLYYLGDWICTIMIKVDWYILFRMYNWFMIASVDVQDWAGNKTPWSKVEPNINNVANAEEKN